MHCRCPSSITKIVSKLRMAVKVVEGLQKGWAAFSCILQLWFLLDVACSCQLVRSHDAILGPAVGFRGETKVKELHTMWLPVCLLPVGWHVLGEVHAVDSLAC